jgi:hypothetical protein
MASSITVTCPECEKQLKATSEVLGKKIRCKACGATFVGRAAKEATTPAKKPAAKKDVPKKDTPQKDAKAAPKAPAPAPDDDDDDMAAYGVTHEYIGRRCPNCTEPVDEEQVVCLECGYNTSTRELTRRVKINDITGGDVFWWLLPGILCVIAALILLTAWLLYVFMVTEASLGGEETWMGWLGFGGKGAKIYTGLVALFIIYKCTRFAIKRLIQNNKPPEVEDKSREDDDEEDDD